MTNKRNYDISRLLFRRQFIMGPRFVDDMPSWNTAKVGDKFFLTVHPDLQISQATHEDKSVTLLGYILNAEKPEADNLTIVQSLLEVLKTSESMDTFPQSTYGYGGRWVLIADNGNDARMFHDAMGYRQIFYTNRDYLHELWCASQPGVIAETLKLTVDAEARSQFENTKWYQSDRQCIAWPAFETPFREISHLLPNFYLDLNSGECRRYWPDASLRTLSLEECVEKNARLLTQLITAASKRYPMAFTITAGWDTRLLLAASRELSNQIYYFSLRRSGAEYERDIHIPDRLLRKLKLNHHIVRFPAAMDPAFQEIYERSVTAAHKLSGIMAQALYDQYPEGRLCVTGNAFEITRVRFRIPGGRSPTAKDLARVSGFGWGGEQAEKMAENSFVTNAWGKWLSKLQDRDIYNVHLMDLFYWEHWAGNFGAMGQAEWDIIMDEFTPYSCRNLLTNMLGVDERFRDHDEPVLHRSLAARMWPQALCEPVNPTSPLIRIRGLVKHILIVLRLYKPVREAMRAFQ